MGRRVDLGGDGLEEEQLGEQVDAAQQWPGHARAEQADDGGDGGKWQQAGVAVEVAAGTVSFMAGAVGG